MAGGDHIPELDRKGLRSFGLMTGGIVIALFALLLPWFMGRGLPVWPWIVGGVLAVWSVAAPRSLRPVYRAWMRFGLLLSQVTIPLVMGLVFYVMVTPLGLVRRGFARDDFAKHPDRSLATYRLPKAKINRDDLKRPF